MSKVVQAINKMIENSNRISSVMTSLSNQNEFYFLYDNYKWSIVQNISEFSIFYYPDERFKLEELAALDPAGFNTVRYIAYKTDDIKTQEAYESFNELYNIIKNKLYGADDVLDEIINS